MAALTGVPDDEGVVLVEQLGIGWKAGNEQGLQLRIADGFGNPSQARAYPARESIDDECRMAGGI